MIHAINIPEWGSNAEAETTPVVVLKSKKIQWVRFTLSEADRDDVAIGCRLSTTDALEN
ncbi:hypothetical protein NR402_01525 [Acidithiobacillus ferrooxidans]|jgi:hypothetical protein|uniref:hypothetical protein n=1 Tax=Acidithiobacillus ferrooxidans TaxID=920 RepID=UPI0013D66FD7|nr:hypothetical protein [Acidithiobacillus ferrooxidans]MBU2861941.1 hypothetical protein [Acidithiobacillus ferrooxidans]MCR2828971.1 hypothetical protein [Acidithiobacillus ferrooxidans]